MSDANALEVDRLTVGFDGADVIRDLSFNVPRGSSLAVVGPNGAGKTVLLRSLIGAIPHEGTIRWAPGTRIGYVPQRLDIERNLPITGHDFLAARSRLAGAADDAIERTLARVGLGPDVLRRLVGQLSGGEFQRLLIGFALLDDPSVLLLDEPTAGVDEPGREHVDETVRRLRVEEHVTVIFISHDVNVVARFADQVLLLGGPSTFIGNPSEALRPEILARAYGQLVSGVRDDKSRD